MNVLLYMIVGWIFGEFLHLTLWEWFKNKYNLDNRKVRTILAFVGIALIIAIIGSGFYRVTSSENVILTSISGNKIVKDNVGIKYSLLSSREEVNIQKQIMKFPISYSENGYEIITSDEKPLLINSYLEYKIKDTYKWGIENKDSEQKLLVLFSSNVINTIQKTDYEYIRNNLDVLEKEIKKELLSSEQNFGIELINVNLQLSDTIQVKHAKSEAESQKIKSEAEKEAYISEAEALQTKYSSLDDKDFIKYMEFIKAIKEGDIDTIIMPNLDASYNIQTNEMRR